MNALFLSSKTSKLLKLVVDIDPLKIIFFVSTAIKSFSEDIVDIPINGFQFIKSDMIDSRVNNNTALSDSVHSRPVNIKGILFIEDDIGTVVGLMQSIDGKQAQPKPESSKTKECPIYEQLCTIFADSGADGKYAQSSHYEGLEKSAGMDISFKESGNLAPPSSSTPLHSTATSQQTTTRTVAGRKRKCPSDIVPASGQSRGKERINAMAEAMWEMIAASKHQTVVMPQVDGRFTICKCIKALDEIEGVPDNLYYAALDLFDNPSLREMFICLNSSSIQLTWLQGKCANLASFI
ncbi:hypothetical protein HAX54_017882 [Datura stramonium]|uniref:Uncharacterized protein n=1 Tax=Datura stramonium TaxID=4076 RepID=A0ABS8ULJ3_DATST|nr:hypothetical protein [Datura stramonium]